MKTNQKLFKIHFSKKNLFQRVKVQLEVPKINQSTSVVTKSSSKSWSVIVSSESIRSGIWRWFCDCWSGYFNLGNFKLKLWNTARLNLLCEKRLLEKYVSTFSANIFLWTVPQCTKFPFKKIFLEQVKPREGGSSLTPTINDLKMCKYWQLNENNKDAFEEG